jgi:hypothetical protein
MIVDDENAHPEGLPWRAGEVAPSPFVQARAPKEKTTAGRRRPNSLRMSFSERLMKTAIALGALALAGLAAAPLALAKSAAPLAALDTDKDGTVDATEINRAAEALFDRLDKDRDGTLDIKELQGRLSKKDFKAADPDNDGTLTRDEFLNAAGNLFKSADPDKEGRLDARQLASGPGKALLRLTR